MTVVYLVWSYTRDVDLILGVFASEAGAQQGIQAARAHLERLAEPWPDPDDIIGDLHAPRGWAEASAWAEGVVERAAVIMDEDVEDLMGRIFRGRR